MTLAEIRAAIRSNLRDDADPTQSRWSNAEIDRYINAGLIDIAKSSARRKISSQAVTSDTKEIVLPAECLILDSLAWEQDGIKHPVNPADDDMPESDATGLPAFYWIFENYLHLRPVPNANDTLWFTYHPRPPALVNDNDTPTFADVDNLLIAYGTWKCYFADGDAQYQLAREEYTMELGKWLTAEKKQQYKTKRVRNRLGRWLNG